MSAELEEPRRPQNAYWIWLSENRDSIVKELGSAKGSAVSKLGGERWKSLTESGREPFEKRAVAAKVEYEKAMQEFLEAGGQAGKRRQEKADGKAARVDKKSRKEERAASGQPKRPASAYWIWLGENREKIVAEIGSSSVPAVGKRAGEKWKEMSDALKAPYEKRAAALKEEYEKEVAAWRAGGCDEHADGVEEA